MQNDNIFADSKWLIFPGVDANLARTSFDVSSVKKADLHITALGYFEAYVNGLPVSDLKCIPAMSDYEKRDLTRIHMPIYDELSHRIYYHSFDITDKLIAGKNTLSVHVGAGWYGQSRSRNEGMPRWGDNLLVFRLEITDCSGNKTVICSSADNTRWKKSYILESSLYFGEYHNAVLYEKNWMLPEYDDSDWNIPVIREAPDSHICKTDFPSDKIIRTVRPELISSFGDIHIYDFGELVSGYAVVCFDDNANTNDTAVIRYADELNEDGSLEFHYCGGTHRMQRDTFIYDDGKDLNEFYPHFTWHSARYAEVTGRAYIKEFRVIHSDIPRITDFCCGNETLNWIFDAYVRTQLDNIHGCIPSDCPHRERLGYTGDGQLTCKAVMSVFDARKMYKKWIRDILDCQDKKGGHVQHTAPFYGGGGGPGGWGGAICIVPYSYYEFYGDISVLEETYDGMKAYIGYMLRHSEEGLVTSSEKGGWCLGDWCPPHNDVKIPEPFVNTYFLAKCAGITAKTAQLLGKEEDAFKYASIKMNAENALISHYYDTDTESFCEGVQGADAFAVDLGIGTAKTLLNIYNKYSALKCFDTGIFGTDILIRVLFEKGYGNLAISLLTNETEDSYYNMKIHGATTLWENWEGCDSRCHPMFGAIVEYFISFILGIKRADDKPGYAVINVSPAYLPELKTVSGKMKTPYGTVTVEVAYDNEGKQTVRTEIDGEIKIM